MIKIKLVDPFYDPILETELPAVPRIDETLTLFLKNEYVEYEVKAVNYCFDIGHKFSYCEITVELGTSHL